MKRTHFVHLLCVATLWLVGCPNNSHPPGDNSGTTNAASNIDPQSNNTANGQNTTVNATANNTNSSVSTFDCSVNIRGEIPANPDATALSGVEIYRYELDRATSTVNVGLFDGGGVKIGQFDLNFADATRMVWLNQQAPSVIGTPRGTLTMASGETISFDNQSDALWGLSPTVRDENGRSTAYAGAETVTVALDIDGRQLLITGDHSAFSNEASDLQYVVTDVQAAGVPTVGEVDEHHVADGAGGFVVRRDYTLPVDSSDTATVEQFLRQTGFDAAVDGQAFRQLMVLMSDTTWALRTLEHLASCITGLDVNYLDPAVSPFINLAACDSAVEQGVGLFGLGVATLGLPATGVGFAGGVAAFMGFLLLAPKFMTNTLACFCTESGSNEFTKCEELGIACTEDRCREGCQARLGNEAPCKKAVVTIDGACGDQNQLLIDRYGYSPRMCECDANKDEWEEACSTADPHILTWDRFLYSPQVSGEFLMARSIAGDFELQGRMEEAASDLCPSFAYNTAVAFRWGAHRMAIYFGEDDRRIVVDGTVLGTALREMTLEDGSTIERKKVQFGDDAYLLRTASGPMLFVRVAHAHLQYSLLLPDPMADMLGLFGTMNGDALDELQDPSGVVFSSPLSYLALADLVVRPWQITDAESLFDYRPGQSTATFTRDDFPSALLTSEVVPEPERSEANDLCRDAGVTDPFALQTCVIDVACADPGFVNDHLTDPVVDALVQIDASDYSDWTVEGLQVGWVAAPTGAVEQPSNAALPTFFVSGDDHFDAHISGYITPTGGDDDVVGIVFGYGAPLAANADAPTTYDTFVFGWKERAQGGVWGAAEEGHFLAHVHGSAPDNDTASSWFWAPTDPGVDTTKVEVIATNFGDGTGYTDGFPHRFDLFYSSRGIRIDIDGTTIFDVPAQDVLTPLLPGRFGFFALSQEVSFRGFGSSTLP